MINLTPRESWKKRKLLPQNEALQLIPEAMARECMAMPLQIEENTLRVAMVNPSDIFAIEALATQTQMRVEPELATAEEIQEAIDFNYKAFDEIEKQVSNFSLPNGKSDIQLRLDKASNAPVARALTLIVDEAVKARASDIHLEPQNDRLQVRYRIDGTLRSTLSLPPEIATPLVSRIKILANMNIADHHRPQDGRFSVETKGRLIDVRVATVPIICGEMAVLRLLDKSQATLNLSQLGFMTESLNKFESMLRVPYGMILVSGPTGAGKTTTLYAALNSLDQSENNIITVEDPVEYQFKSINQIQVNPRAGITFASGLKSILRLDPDVILVGEIRDSETARIAIQSALTGHLVLSSIHANDAVGVIFRLLDLGIEPFLVSSAVIGIIAQRMVRKVCPDCASLARGSVIEQIAYEKEIGEESHEFAYGSGCKTCASTGYRGRIGIFEILSMTEEMRALVMTGTTTSGLRVQAVKEGMLPLVKDGMLKVRAGITNPAEILRNAYSVE